MLQLIALAALSQPAIGCGFATLHASLHGTTEHVEICARPSERGSDPDYVFHRTISGPNAPLGATTASTATCVAARPVFLELETLPLPRPDIPGRSPRVRRQFQDGSGYTLQIGALYDLLGSDLSVSSNGGTPLALWSSRLLRALEPCWRPSDG